MTIAKAKEEAVALSKYIVENYDKIGAQNSKKRPEWDRLQYLRTFILMETLKQKQSNK
jgi:predicted nucleotidyltransferase